MLTETQIRELAALGGPKVRARLKKMCPTAFSGVQVASMDGVGYALAKDENSGYTLIEIRNSGKYEGRAFYLDTLYGWNIQKDDEGCLVLIPRKK